MAQRRTVITSVRLIAAIAIGLSGMLLAFGLDPTPASAATLRPVKTLNEGRTIVFKPRGLAVDRVTRVSLSHRGRRRGLSAKSVRRMLERRGEVRIKVPGSWVPNKVKPSRAAKKRKSIARRTRLVVSVSRPAPDPQQAPASLRVGLISNAQGWDMNSGSILEETTATGVGWVREEFSWAQIEPQNDAWSWERYDTLLLEAAARDIRVLPILMDTPSWAGANWNTIPTNPAEYAEYTAKVTERYGPGGSFWQSHPEAAAYAPEHFEFWNEPFLDYFSDGGVNPARYARMVKAAATAGRAANPQSKFLLAGELAPSDASSTWIDDMYAAVPDLNSYFDAVAVHPYTGSHSPDDVDDGWGFPRIAGIHQKFADHGADVPLWITEIGWSTCPDNAEYCTSEANQAAYIARMFELLATKYSGYVEGVFLYHRTDHSYDDPSDKEGYFGLERLDGSRKPAFDVLRSVTGA